MNTSPKPRLRWYQYSLRSLLVLMVLVASLGSWFAVKRQQLEKQRAAVKAIGEMGGEVEYDYQLDGSGRLNLDAEPPGPAWLRNLLGDDFFTHVVCVYLDGSPITDAGLEHLKGLTRLKELLLNGPQVTDAGLEHLKGLTQLQFLGLNHTHVTDAGLGQLNGLTQLQWLDLDGAQVTGAGLQHLKVLPQLDSLVLSSSFALFEG
jgi:hypothetical protein